MKKQSGGHGPVFDVEDTFGGVVDSAARLLFWLGVAATLVGLGFLFVTYNAFASGGIAGTSAQALGNIELLQKVLLGGVIGILVGTTYMFWGEETLPVLQLFGAAALWFSPMYLPSLIGGTPNNVTSAALAAIQLSGTIFGLLAIGVLVIDITVRVKARAKMGSRADQMRYGKGVKEEEAVKNVLMGKCWQLPFCRKFVRDKCPIFLARRTCWKEGVGCMCEEEVIRGAMSSRAIPKDVVAAAKYIPVNNKLTPAQKMDRCRQCVIYNEHQKHKYKVALPVTVLAFAGLYMGLRTPLLVGVGEMMKSADKMLSGLTFNKTDTVSTTVAKAPLFQEIFLVCVMVVALAYVLKMLEYAVFKLKI